MEDHLTAQELADHLQVTRQLIYYHAKKIPHEEKVYSEDNKLVFTPEQQVLLKSFMTETFDSQKSLANVDGDKEALKDKMQFDIPVSDEEENFVPPFEREFTYDPELAKQISLVMQNEEESNENSFKPLSSKESEEENIKGEPLDTISAQTIKSETKTVDKSSSLSENYSQEPLIRQFIESTVKEQLQEKWLQDEEERQYLIEELQTKNRQISDLHQLLDQQQQLMLLTEQKNHQLLDQINALQIGHSESKPIKASKDWVKQFFD